MLKEKRISKEWVEELLCWRNSGFNIHNQVKIGSQDEHGRESLAQYILRSPFSQEKMIYPEDTGMVLYRSKMKPGSKKNSQGEMRIISFIDQPEIIRKILRHLGLWAESRAPPDGNQKEKVITFDPSYSQLV